ncbi:MAG: transporter, partial [candidate division NC10 bacterium]|nr:transporter [candidate division NC10 bacterium]
ILNVTAPFFALVLCGYLAARYRALPENAVPALNTFVLYFALPCMLFRFAAGAPFGDILNLPVFLAYMVTGLAVFALSAATVRYGAGENVREAAFAALAVAWSNWGYMGIPLIPALLGQRALAALIAAGMADLLVVVSAALALASLENRAGGARAAFAGALIHIGKNPLIWAVIVGGTFSAFELRLPAAMDQFVGMLGQAAGPVALFTIGASLYRPGTRTRGADVLAIAGAKLLLHPGVAAVVAVYTFHLTRLEVQTLVLAAALPVGGSVFLFAERRGADAERIAAVILVSTALAFVTFSVLCWTLGIQMPD